MGDFYIVIISKTCVIAGSIHNIKEAIAAASSPS